MTDIIEASMPQRDCPYMFLVRTRLRDKTGPKEPSLAEEIYAEIFGDKVADLPSDLPYILTSEGRYFIYATSEEVKDVGDRFIEGENSDAVALFHGPSFEFWSLVEQMKTVSYGIRAVQHRINFEELRFNDDDHIAVNHGRTPGRK